MEVKITLIKRKSFSKIRNAKLIALLTVIFIGGSVGVEAQTSPFPADAWGVYSWTQFTNIDKNTAPLAKGGPIIMRWTNIEPQNGVFAFDAELKPKLQRALDNNFYVFLKIYLAAPSPSGFTPEWLYSSGVPKVEAGGSFPYYFDEDYKLYYYRLIAEFGRYVQALPANLKSRILFVQSTEGTTGDGGYYKSDPAGTQFDITRAQWEVFRLEAWKKFKEAFSKNGVLQIPILTNNDANTVVLKDWMLDELPGAIGVKNGMFTHGYQISDAQIRLRDHLLLKSESEAAGKVFYARGEMDAEMNENGWITQNKKQGIYWSAIYATHCAVSMWNFPQDELVGSTYDDGIKFFNKYAGEINPQSAKGAFCALYRGLDASDTVDFPVSIHGTATKSNQQRYLSICNAYKDFGAKMADPAAATGGGIVNRSATGFNDAGWQILKTNFQRHLTQIDAESTSDAWWQVDNTVYGRFARGFAANNTAKSKMYFDLDDKFFGTTPLNGAQTIEVSVTYRDSDAGSWALKYDATDGTIKTAGTVTNLGTGTNVWKTKKFTITDAYLGNRGAKSSDFIIENLGNTSCRFHMIAVDKTLIINTRVSGVSLTGCPTAAMTVNATNQLTATVSPIDATNKSVNWSSSNTAIATVSNTGLVTAISAGLATITVTTVDGNKTAECSVTISVAVTGVTVSGCLTSTMIVNATNQLTATVVPTDATNKLVTWSSTNTAIATVSNTGLVTAISAGSATITVTTVDGNKTAVCDVNVVVPVSGVSISGCLTSSMNVNATNQLTATVAPTNATNKSVNWSSSNTAVATVSSTGLVTAIAAGSATITVITVDGNKTAVCNVTVATSAPAQTPYGGVNRKIPGFIEAEHYDEGVEGSAFHDNTTKQGVLAYRADDMVDVVNKTAASNGKAVGYALNGEWLEYKVDVTAGTYDIKLSYFCTISTAGDLKVSLSGIVLTTFTNIVAQTSGTVLAQTTIRNIPITGGTNKTLRLEVLNGAKFDIDAIDFFTSATTTKISSGKTAESESVDNGFRIYPNPVSDVLNLEFTDATSSKQIKVFNAIGQLVYSAQTTKGSATIDIKTLNMNGVVMVQVVVGGSVYNNKVIIK